MIAVILITPDGAEVVLRTFKENHDDAETRALAHAKSLGRAAANHALYLPDYRVVGRTGEHIWHARRDQDILDLVKHMDHGDIADVGSRRYRKRT